MPQGREAVQGVQQAGDAAEEAGAVAHGAGLQVERVEGGAHLLFEALALLGLLQAFVGEAGAARAGEDVGEAAFALQRVREAADHVDQFAGVGQLLEFGNLALACGEEERGSGSHLTVRQQQPCRLVAGTPAVTLERCWCWESNRRATKPASRWCRPRAAPCRCCWRTPCTARWTCTRPMA